jgi:hypothetical protein
LGVSLPLIIVREDGIGPAKIGMSFAPLSSSLHQKPSEEDSGSESRFYVHGRGHDHIDFMIIDARRVRIDLDAPGILTTSGLQVGDSEARARKVCGPKMKVVGHKYVDRGRYLTGHSHDRRYGVRFETDKGKITML